MLSISIAVFLVHSLLCSPCWARVAVCLWNSLFIVLCLRDSVVAPWAAGPLLFCSLSSVASVYTHTSNQTLVSFYCQSSSTIILHVSMDILIHSFSTPPHFSVSTPSLLDDSVLHPPTQVFFIYLFRDSCFWTPEPTSCALLVNSLPPSLLLYFILVSLSPCNLGQKRTNMSLSSSKNVWNPPKVVYPFL